MRDPNRFVVLDLMTAARPPPAVRLDARVASPRRSMHATRGRPMPAEERMLEIVEVAYVLRADSFPIPETFERLSRVYGAGPPVAATFRDSLRDFIADHLQIHDPEYVALSADLLDAALVPAIQWAEDFATRLTASSWPPPEMLREPWVIDGYTGIVREGEGPHEWPTFTRSLQDLDILLAEGHGQDVRRMKARAVLGDELRGYSTGGLSWTAMMGSAGIALVRNSRSIDFVETIFN